MAWASIVSAKACNSMLPLAFLLEWDAKYLAAAAPNWNAIPDATAHPPARAATPRRGQPQSGR